MLSCVVCHLVLLGVFGTAAAGPAETPREGRAGADSLRQGYWGEFPAPADSVTAEFRDRRLPAWEYPLYGAYQVIALPVRGLQWLTTETLQGLDDLGAFHPVDPLLRGLPGPFGTRIMPNFRAGGLAGFGGGLNVHHWAVGGSRSNRFRLHWQSTVEEATKLTMGVILGDDDLHDFQFGAGYRRRPNARYFGLGPATAPEDESYFTQESAWVGAHLTRRLGRDFAWRVGAKHTWLSNRGPREDVDEPRIEDVFAGALPEGWSDRSDGLVLSLALIHDDTESDGRHAGGGTRRLKASVFDGTGGREDEYWTYRAEFEQFFPLWHTYRALALRGAATWIDTDDPVHFQRLLTNDDPDLLRGYRDFRFRDRGLLSLTAEYRWPILAWNDVSAQGLDAYVFTDLGQVFGELEEVALPRLTDSYGFGLRLLGGDGRFSGRLEVAFSDEETVLRLRGDQVFQFAKRGLFHGRVPIPDR